jgi:hypothetical protein
MTTSNHYRYPGEDAARPEKENAPVCETEAPSATAPAHDTPDAPRETTRPLFHALTWRGTEVQQQDADQAQTPTEKTPDPVAGWHALAAPAKAKLPRGKGRRDARRAALQAKRHQAGGATLDAMCLAAGVFWLASVCAWLLVEVLQ